MSFASWKKCDFQLHTPRDPNWQGERPVGIGDETESGPATQEQVTKMRLDWARTFIDRCVARGLEAIAITDHHEMVMFSYVKQEIAQRKGRDPSFNLWLFPGMELTCRNGVQCLILFDADLSDEWLRDAQTKLGISIASLNEKARTACDAARVFVPKYCSPARWYSGTKGALHCSAKCITRGAPLLLGGCWPCRF